MRIYECPICWMRSNSLSWDKSTMEKLNIKSYDDNYGKIEDEREFGCIYICPNCGEEVDGDKIKEV